MAGQRNVGQVATVSALSLMSRFADSGALRPKGRQPPPPRSELPRRGPIARVVVSGCFTDSPLPRTFLSSQEVTDSSDFAALYPLSGDLSIFPSSRLPYLRMLGGASVGGIAWIPTLAYREGVHPALLVGWARSMLRKEHGVPSGAFVAFGRFCLLWLWQTRNDRRMQRMLPRAPRRRRRATMSVPAILFLVACCLSVLCYVVWRHNFPK